MPSFDVVSEVDLHQLTNAVDQAGRIIANRFDFKGVDASFEREERTVLLTADAEFQLDQMQDMLRSALVKCDLDPKAMEIADPVTSGKQVKDALGRQAITVNGRALGADDNTRPASCFEASQALYGRYFLLKLGKKKHHLFDLG